MIIISKVPPRE